MILIEDTLDQLSQEQIAGILSACGYAIREGSVLSTALRELGFHIPGFNDQDCFLLEESADLIEDNDLAQLAVLCAQKLGIIVEKQKKSTPKTLGHIARETWELFEAGWQHADKFVKERQQQANHEKDAQGCIRLLETALYDSASRGDTTEKVKALNYFKTRLQPSEIYFGDHILSGFAALCTVSVICLVVAFGSRAMCTGSTSTFCKDVNTGTSHVTDYFANPGK